MKKIKKPLFFLALFFVVLIFSFVISVLKHNGIWLKLTNGVNSFSFCWYPLIIIIAFLVTLAVHETAHLIFFVVRGVKIRGIFIFIFSFYKKKKKWHFKINFNHAYLGGGFVVPDIPLIDDDNKYEKIRSDFAISLIGAPIVTIVFATLIFLTFLLILIFSNNALIIGIAMIFMFFVIIISVIYIISSFLNTDNMFGDFVAHKKIKTNDLFSLVQLTQYNMFSDNSKESLDFFHGKTVTKLRQIPKYDHLFHYSLVDHYIDGLLYHDLLFSKSINDRILDINILSVSRNYSLGFGHNLIRYHHFVGLTDKAISTFHELSKSNDEDSIEHKFITKKTSHLLGFSDESEFIDNPKNVKFEAMKLFGLVYDFAANEVNHNEVLQPLYVEEKKGA